MSVIAKTLLNEDLTIGDSSPLSTRYTPYHSFIPSIIAYNYQILELDNYNIILDLEHNLTIFKKSTGKMLTSIPVELHYNSNNAISASVKICKVSATSFMITYDNAFTLSAKVIKIVDDDVILGALYVFETFLISVNITTSSATPLYLEDNKIFIAYNFVATSPDSSVYDCKARIIMVSDTIVTAGAPVIIIAKGSGANAGVSHLSAHNLGLACVSPTQVLLYVSLIEIDDVVFTIPITGATIGAPVTLTGFIQSTGSGTKANLANPIILLRGIKYLNGDLFIFFNKAGNYSNVTIRDGTSITRYSLVGTGLGNKISLLLLGQTQNFWDKDGTLYISVAGTANTGATVNSDDMSSFGAELYKYTASKGFTVVKQSICPNKVLQGTLAEAITLSTACLRETHSIPMLMDSLGNVIVVSVYNEQYRQSTSFKTIFQSIRGVISSNELIPLSSNLAMISGATGKSKQITNININTPVYTERASMPALVDLLLDDKVYASYILDSSVSKEYGNRTISIDRSNRPIIVNEGQTLKIVQRTGTIPARVVVEGIEKDIIIEG